MIVVDTEERLNQPKWFVIEDINRRAEAAYTSNPEFFDNPDHQAAIELAEEVIRKHARLWQSIFHTARSATKSQAIHTELKFDKIEFRKNGKAEVDAALQALGIHSNDIVYKPQSLSLSVRIK